MIMEKIQVLRVLISVLVMASCVACTNLSTPFSNIEPPISADNYEWIIEPTLNYDDIIYYESMAEYAAFKGSDSVIIKPDDIIQGKLVETEVPGMGIGGGIVVYDIERKIWGSIHFDSGETYVFKTITDAINYTKNHSNLADTFPVLSITVEDITSDNFVSNYEINWEYAFATTDGFVTDFIFDETDGYPHTNNPAVMQNNKWGFIDKTGELIIPYEFDDAISIDNERAFVKQNGKWGVISKAIR